MLQNSGFSETEWPLRKLIELSFVESKTVADALDKSILKVAKSLTRNRLVQSRNCRNPKPQSQLNRY